MVAIASGQWVGKTEAARVLNVTLYRLNKLIERRALSTRTLPGDRQKVSGDDIIRILEQSKDNK